MLTLLRALTFPVACALTGAAAALLVHTLGAPAPECPPPAPPPAVVFAPAPPPAPPPPPTLVFTPPPPASAAQRELAIPDSAIRCSEPRRCAVSRSFLDTLFANPSLLAGQARVMPSIRDGEARGFKLYGLRPEGIARRLGLANGDLLRGVNGEPLLTMEHAMSAVSRLRHSRTLDLDIERKGEALQLHLAFE